MHYVLPNLFLVHCYLNDDSLCRLNFLPQTDTIFAQNVGSCNLPSLPNSTVEGHAPSSTFDIHIVTHGESGGSTTLRNLLIYKKFHKKIIFLKNKKYLDYLFNHYFKK